MNLNHSHTYKVTLTCTLRHKTSPALHLLSVDTQPELDTDNNGLFPRRLILAQLSSLYHHRLNMELDLKSLFGLLCTAVLNGWDPATPPLPPHPPTHLGSYTRALLVIEDRRHSFVTPLVSTLRNGGSRKRIKIIEGVVQNIKVTCKRNFRQLFEVSAI